MGGDRALLLSSVWESAASFALVFLALLLLRIPPLPAALTAVAGISVSPVVLLATVRELGAQGPMTRRALNLVALNHVMAFLAYAAVLPFLHYAEHQKLASTLIEPFYQLLGSALVAFLLFRLLMLARRWTGENGADHFLLSAGVIVLGVGVAELLSLSGLLTLFSLGLMVRNLDGRSNPDTVDFGQAGEIFVIVLFVVVGAKLEIKEPGAIWWAALAFVAARFAGKWLAVSAISKQFGLPALQAESLGLTLLPMAGMAIGLAHAVSQMYPGAGQTFSAIVLAAVAIVETVSPSVTEYALKRMGEAA